jgi:hypothetical protein
MQAIQVAMPHQPKAPGNGGGVPAIPDVFLSNPPPSVAVPVGGFVDNPVPINDLGNPSQPLADPNSPPPMSFGNPSSPPPSSYASGPIRPPTLFEGPSVAAAQDEWETPPAQDEWETPPAREQVPTVFQDSPNPPLDTTAPGEVEGYLEAMQNSLMTKPPQTGIFMDSGNPHLGPEVYPGQFVPSPGVSHHGAYRCTS